MSHSWNPTKFLNFAFLLIGADDPAHYTGTKLRRMATPTSAVSAEVRAGVKEQVAMETLANACVSQRETERGTGLGERSDIYGNTLLGGATSEF